MEDLSHWNGAPRPAPVVLDGHYVRLEPLDAAKHADDLYASAIEPGAEERFRYLFDNAPHDRASFDEWFRKAASAHEPLFFAVIDKATGRAEGRQSLMRIDPLHGVIEIGSILWGPAIARSRITTEAFYLFARHVFDDLGYRRFEWKCDNSNLPSKKAALRFGFSPEGLFRHHMVLKGRNRDTAWFSITREDWEVLRPIYEAWLNPANFDAEGQQRQKLDTRAITSASSD